MVVIITIVSLLLSITSGSLRSFQEDNVRLDTKKQILNSLPGIELGEDAAATYAATIKEYNMLDAEGNVVKSLDPVADFDVKAEEGQFPMYVAEIDGETKYILPMNGAGLWGAIWGYMALNDDRNTGFGVFFNHAGETPGLGAEIVTENFRNPFIGKHLLNAENQFVSIAIEKAGTKVEGRDQVDAISGGTITSKGVETMLSTSLGNYEKFLAAPAAIVVEEVVDSVIVEPVIEGGN